MKKQKRKISYLLLTGAMLLSSFAGCGKKEATVENYGVDPSGTDAVVSTPSDTSLASVQKARETLTEQFGEKIKWNGSFTAQDITFITNYTFSVPQVDFLNMYRVKDVVSSTEGEQAFADRFFDDGAKKLEKLEYTDATKYMIQMYQYRNLIYSIGINDIDLDSMTDEEMVEALERDNSIITAESNIDYGWVDEDTHALHMYEGTYNGVNFGLLIGYDFFANRKYVYFEPTDINEYFPGENYQTLMLEGSQSMVMDGTGTTTPAADNKCTMSEQEVYDTAAGFIQGKFDFSEYDAQLSDEYEAYNGFLADAAGSMYASYYDDVPTGISMMTFTDGDYVSSQYVCANEIFGYRSAERLAEQTDYVYQYMEDYNMDLYYEAFYRISSNSAYRDDNVTAERDGYAVYVNSPFQIDTPEGDYYVSYYSNASSANAGCVKITSKGIYGVDMVTSVSVLDVTEGVALMDFESIKEALATAIEENYDPSVLGNENFNLHDITLVYESVEDEDGDGEYDIVPAWVFSFGNSNGLMYIILNAMDGSLISIEQYSYRDY